MFLLLLVNQKLIQALLQFVKFFLFPLHLMIILAGPACNYVLKFLNLAGEKNKHVSAAYVVGLLQLSLKTAAELTKKCYGM